MPPAAPARKRNRKRKRRAAASSSSSSSSSSSEDESPQLTTRPVPVPTRVVVQVDSSDSDSDSSSSSSSGSDSDSDAGGSVKSISGLPIVTTKPKQRQESRSPSPPSPAIPPFLPAPGTEGAQKREEELRARFRKFWMASIADGFRDDLEELHKEPNLSESRLGLLIDSLASGADVFIAGPSGGANRGFESASGENEMEIVLNETS
ncbi:hypothetical protein FS749_015787 [Ceratobasidium sp. UAMH 11750]|nr:hypothetical protein FS749_015787 [Ceratobasidium sp. UAMH 11750]